MDVIFLLIGVLPPTFQRVKGLNQSGLGYLLRRTMPAVAQGFFEHLLRARLGSDEEDLRLGVSLAYRGGPAFQSSAHL